MAARKNSRTSKTDHVLSLLAGGSQAPKAETAPATNSSESPGRNGVTTSPVSQKMMRKRMAYVHR